MASAWYQGAAGREGSGPRVRWEKHLLTQPSRGQQRGDGAQAPPPHTRRPEPAAWGDPSGQPHLSLQVGLERLGLVEQGDAALSPARQGCAVRGGGADPSRLPGPAYLIWVAGSDSSCRERNSSRCRNWCLSFSGRSTISGFSISSSISPEGQRARQLALQRPANRLRTPPLARPGVATELPAGPQQMPWCPCARLRPGTPKAQTPGSRTGRQKTASCVSLRSSRQQSRRENEAEAIPSGDGRADAHCGAQGWDSFCLIPLLAPAGPWGELRQECRDGQAGGQVPPQQHTDTRTHLQRQSYLPRRCRPLVRFYSRLTRL